MRLARSLSLAVLAGFFLVACESDDPGTGGGTFVGTSRVLGQARIPSTGISGSPEVPLASARVTVVDQFGALGQVGRGLARTTVVGETDAEGRYEVLVDSQDVAAIVIQGELNGAPIRVSGLVNPNATEVAKDFTAITDVACEAGVGAINGGSLNPADVGPSFVSALEVDAEEVLRNTPVDLRDPAAVSSAANQVRENQGITPPPPVPEEEPPAEEEEAVVVEEEAAPVVEETPAAEESPVCPTGEFTCDDGNVICADQVCNSQNDCADGSDEDAVICGSQSSCCSATNGCPDETPTSCSDSCCCCGIGEICDQSNFANGCKQVGGQQQRSELGDLLKRFQ